MRTRRDFLRSGAALSLLAARPGGACSLFSGEEMQVQMTLPALTAGHGLSIGSADAIGNLTRSFMEKSGVTAGQIAVVQGGALVLSRVYATKPPSGYAPVDARSLFRIASCSKMFTCAAITALRSRGDLDLDAAVFPLLEIREPGIRKDKPDPRIDTITVRHLVNHAGGWNDHESVVAKDGTHVPGTEWDPMFGARQIALELHLNRPPTKLEIAQYMYGKKLQFAPGSQDFNSTQKRSYSNLGYMLLGLVVEKLAKQPFLDFIRTGLGAENETAEVYLSRLLDGRKDPREVWYVSSGSSPTQLKPTSSELARSAYGGDFTPELHDSAGGLMTNAETLALFSAHHAVWGLGGRAARSARSGSLPGTSSFTYSRANGIDCAFVLNTREFNGGPKQLDEFSDALQGLLDRSTGGS